MRYISLEDIEANIPPDWSKRAAEALRQISEAAEEDRAKLITRQALWTELKETLWRASKKKCWYCESIDVRSDNAVDHFRPKNRVVEAFDSKHSGYWWLAFDWRNYRFSCTFCNSYRKSAAGGGGKHDHFPLWREDRRARKPDDSLEDEEPILLDPTSAKDIVEIAFAGNGAVVEAVTKEENSYRYSRAYESIKIYHLNEPSLTERRAQLMRKIEKQLKDANRFRTKVDGNDRSAEEALDSKLSETFRALRPNAEYSAAARYVVGSLRGKYPWVDRLLISAI